MADDDPRAWLRNFEEDLKCVQNDLEPLECVTRLLTPAPGSRVRFCTAAWSPSGTEIAISGVRKHSVGIYANSTGALLQEFAVSGDDDVLCLAWSPDGRSLMSMADETRLHHLSAGESAIIQSNTITQRWGCWSPDGTRVVVPSRARAPPGTLSEIEVATGEVVRKMSVGYEVTWMAYSPCGKLFAADRDRRKMQIYDAAGWGLIRSVELQDDVFTAAWSPTCMHISVACCNSLWLLHVADGSVIWKKAYDWGPWATFWDPTARYLAAGSIDGCLRVWSAMSGECLPSFDLAPSRYGVRTAQWSSDGTHILSADDTGAVSIWRVPFSPWYRRLAAVSARSRLRAATGV